MRAPSKWIKKGSNKVFTGNYERDSKGKRIFVLSERVNGKVISFASFDSHEQAKEKLWEKVR